MKPFVFALWLFAACSSKPEPSPVATKAAEPAPPADAIRLLQGTNPGVGDHQVGVSNIYSDAGTLIVSLSVHDPKTGTTHDVRAKQGDEFSIGAKRYRIFSIALNGPGERAVAYMVEVK